MLFLQTYLILQMLHVVIQNYPSLSTCSVMSSSLWPLGLQPATLLCPWDFPGKKTGVGCHFLLQGIFLTQESNPGLSWAGGFFTTEPPGYQKRDFLENVSFSDYSQLLKNPRRLHFPDSSVNRFPDNFHHERHWKRKEK